MAKGSARASTVDDNGSGTTPTSSHSHRAASASAGRGRPRAAATASRTRVARARPRSRAWGSPSTSAARAAKPMPSAGSAVSAATAAASRRRRRATSPPGTPPARTDSTHGSSRSPSPAARGREPAWSASHAQTSSGRRQHGCVLDAVMRTTCRSRRSVVVKRNMSASIARHARLRSTMGRRYPGGGTAWLMLVETPTPFRPLPPGCGRNFSLSAGGVRPGGHPPTRWRSWWRPGRGGATSASVSRISTAKARRGAR